MFSHSGMPFSVTSTRADAALTELMDLTGEGSTEAVTRALEDRLARARIEARLGSIDMMWRIEQFQRGFAHLRPTRHMTDEELIGYDDEGLPI